MAMSHKHHHEDSDRHGAAQPTPKSESVETALHAQIQRRAYELSQAGKGGSDLDDWLQAEREFVQEEAGPGPKSIEPLDFPQPQKRRVIGEASV